ncbi:uncharacterized protein LOC128227075 [Mya arenaria]|uniref:uncharacterized protein LOC128227075 n=1 Tax=Mya arenaria TaxID=6604 RepID=UPI0022E7829C|nr:uncharacterized protein LOC128227075 [Mya arenaria]
MQLVGILLLQLLATTTDEVSTQDYQKYTGSALTGTILDKTTARSAMRCSSLCAQHGNTGESCHAARYNGETRACELMSRSSSGKERWLSDGEWKIYTNQRPETTARTDRGNGTPGTSTNPTMTPVSSTTY